jgi:hypothetical protein
MKHSPRMDGQARAYGGHNGNFAKSSATISDTLVARSTAERSHALWNHLYQTRAPGARSCTARRSASILLDAMPTVTAGGNHLYLTDCRMIDGPTDDPEINAGFWRVHELLKRFLGPDAPLPIVRRIDEDGIEQQYLIYDIGMRMLSPRELLNAQFGPELAKDYILTGTRESQVAKIGNSVPPYLGAAVIKMPYLRRLRVLLIISKLAAILAILGFVDESPPRFKNLVEKIEWDRKRSGHWPHGYDLSRCGASNRTDKDGQLLNDGDVRCFRTPNGHILRGRIFYSLNNMWRVVIPGEAWAHQIGCYQLFSFDPSRHLRKESYNQSENLAHALDAAVARQDFERCIKIREVIRRLYGEPASFKPGDPVVVHHQRYHGPGIVRRVIAPTWIDVEIPNGNVWCYEVTTVKPAEVAA